MILKYTYVIAFNLGEPDSEERSCTSCSDMQQYPLRRVFLHQNKPKVVIPSIKNEPRNRVCNRIRFHPSPRQCAPETYSNPMLAGRTVVMAFLPPWCGARGAEPRRGNRMGRISPPDTPPDRADLAVVADRAPGEAPDPDDTSRHPLGVPPGRGKPHRARDASDGRGRSSPTRRRRRSVEPRRRHRSRPARRRCSCTPGKPRHTDHRTVVAPAADTLAVRSHSREQALARSSHPVGRSGSKHVSQVPRRIRRFHPVVCSRGFGR